MPVMAAPAMTGAAQTAPRKGRLKQCVTRGVFGRGMSLDQMPNDGKSQSEDQRILDPIHEAIDPGLVEAAANTDPGSARGTRKRRGRAVAAVGLRGVAVDAV